MAAGRPKQLKDNLENFNTKLQASDLKLIRALAQVTPNTQRELIEAMLQLYKEQHPDQVAKAEKYIELAGE